MRSAPFWLVPAMLLLAATAGADRLIVLNRVAREAALVDPATLQVVARVPTGEGPGQVVVSPDQRRAYVSNYGTTSVFRPGEARRVEAGHTITMIDLPHGEVVRTFSLTPHTMPYGMAMSHDGARLWVACEGSHAVLELDTQTGAILETWDTGQEGSHMIVATPDERKLYVANSRSGSVTVIERGSKAVRTLVTGAGAEGLDVSPDGREVWVANRTDHTIVVIDVAADSVVATLASEAQTPTRAKFTPDGSRVLVASGRGNAISLFDAARRQRVGRIKVGGAPTGIEIVPGGTVAFVACAERDRVKRIDWKSRRVTGTFTTGQEPGGMAWARTP